MHQKGMPKATSNLSFRLMALSFKLRDWVLPRRRILREVGIRRGDRVLDYGCGPGSYIGPLAELVGEEGRIYALDLHPLALQMVQRIALRKGLKNVETIPSDCKTGLPGESIDVVLLYDVLHELSSRDDVLRELHRVLKPQGVLSVMDHHMKEGEVVSAVTGGGLFRLLKKGKRTLNFCKA